MACCRALTLQAQDLSDVPVSTLSFQTRQVLSKFLNIENPLISMICGCLIDYRGVAQMRGFDYNDVERFRRSSDPMGEILNEWNETHFYDPNDPPTRSVQSLLDILRYLGRHDIFSELEELNCIDNDVQLYRSQMDALRRREQSKREINCPQQVFEVSSSDKEDFQRYTVEDERNNEKTFYDAGVLFSDDPEDKAAKFVKLMITNLEPDVKLFIPPRDLLGGGYRGKVTCDLIENRCRRLVIIVTKGYKRSKECEFQTQYAHCLSPGASGKKLLPVVIEDCPPDGVLKPITPIDYCRDDCREWFWERLKGSIRSPVFLTKDEVQPVTDFSSIQALDISIQSTITGTDYRKFFEEASSAMLPSPTESENFEMVSRNEMMDCDHPLSQADGGSDYVGFHNHERRRSSHEEAPKRKIIKFTFPKIGKKHKEKNKSDR